MCTRSFNELFERRLIFFRKIKTADRDLSQVQENVANSFGPLLKLPLLNGVQLVDVVLAAGSNKFAHTLDRQPLGWFIVDRDGAATVYRTDWNDKTLSLTASAPITLSLWVF